MLDVTVAVPLDQLKSACAYYRQIQPAAWLKGNGISIETNAPEARVIWLSRCSDSAVLEDVRARQKRGVRYIYDLDDDLFNIPRASPYFAAARPSLLTVIRNFLRYANLITTTTEALRRRIRQEAGHDRIAVIPNAVDVPKDDGVYTASYHPLGEQFGLNPGDVVAAMVAGDKSHIADLSVLDRVMLPASYGWLIWGVGADVGYRLPFHHKHAIRSAEPLASYHRTLALMGKTQTVVGVIPLSRHPFNECKSGLKVLEYGAVGLPVIASRTAEYDSLLADDRGILIDGDEPGAWHQAFFRFESLEERVRVGGKLRRHVLANRTIDHTGPLWSDALLRMIEG